MKAIGNNELGERMEKGDFITCPHCEEEHEVLVGTNLDTGEETDSIMFYKCPKMDKTYLCGVSGRNIMHCFNS